MVEFKQESYSEEQITAGRELFNSSAEFMLGVAALSQLPETSLNEVALAGRSNVGKSSLINALTGKKGLAKASNTPGRTQQLNYFNLGNKIILVDMPGYGYAEAPAHLVKQWQQLIKLYLQGRVNLKRVFVLIDARHGIKKTDEEIMDMLDKAAVTYQIILTKADKISQTALTKIIASTQEKTAKRAAAHVKILATSAEKAFGLDEVRAEIAALAD